MRRCACVVTIGNVSVNNSRCLLVGERLTRYSVLNCGARSNSAEMDSQNLHLYVDFVGSSGVILSTEQKASLQTSLVILKSNHKLAHVKLWGKILGVKDDYYIAQGFSDDQFAAKTTLYRFNFAAGGKMRTAGLRIRVKVMVKDLRLAFYPNLQVCRLVRSLHLTPGLILLS